MARRDASAATIKRFFAESMAARDEQKLAAAVVREQNAKASAAGVDPAVLATCRRIAAMRDGKRGFHVFLLRRYLDVLEGELADATFSAPEEKAAVPFRSAA